MNCLCETDHIHDLLQGEAKLEHYRLGLVRDRPLQLVVLRKQVSGQGNKVYSRTVHCRAVYFSAVQFSAVQFSAVQFSAVEYSAVQFSAVQFSVVQFSAVQYSVVQFSAVQLSAVQFSAVKYSSGCYSAVQYSCYLCHKVVKQPPFVGAALCSWYPVISFKVAIINLKLSLQGFQKYISLAAAHRG